MADGVTSIASVRVGLFLPADQSLGGPERLQVTLARIGEEGVDHACA
jgi:hypothetical protein